MAYSSSIIPDHLSDYSSDKLLEYHDNPQNFQIPDFRDEVCNLVPNSFPDHATILLTHGLFSLKSEDRIAVVNQVEDTKQELYDIVDDRKTTRKQAYRLLRNFSDWGTRKIVQKIFKFTDYNGGKFTYPDNIIIPDSPRIKGDPNRSAEAGDFKKRTDFNKIQLIPRKNQAEDDTGNKNHEIYHNRIDTRLSSVEKEYGGSITFDIHDTGVNKQSILSSNDNFRSGGYPMMEIGTIDGESCNPEILKYFAQQVEVYFGFTPIINEQDTGGYVTQRNGRDARKKLEASGKNPKKRNMMQIELGRYIYMKESTQKLDQEQVEKVAAALRMCIQKTCEEFGDEYFLNLD